MLDSPASEDEIYLARGEEIDAYRPICQGDVFADVEIPGLVGRMLAMVISHPCAMRAGPRLRPRVTVAPVHEHQLIGLGEWSHGHLRVMPLPALLEGVAAHAAKLEEPATIAAERLILKRRVASLSNQGIVLLQQRYIHNHSRASIPLSVLYEVSAAVLEELELQESWNLALVRPAVDAGGELAVLLEQEAEAFDELLSGVVEEHRSLRDLLLRPSERALVRRAVSTAIAERTG